MPPLAAFSPAGLSAAIPSRRVCWWWSWAVLAHSPGGGARSRGSRGREGFARSRPSRALWRLRPPGFFLPPPASSWRAQGFPLFARRWWLSAPAPAEGAHKARQPPAGAGGTYTEGDGGGRTNEGRRDRAGKHCRPPGGWFRALPATLSSSESVRFIGHFLLTFRSSRGKILSKSVMPPWPAVSCHGVRDFAFCGLSGSPRALSSASVRGLFRYTARQGFRFAAPWARFSFTLSRAKITGHSAPPVNSRKRPQRPAFSGG